MDALSMLMTSLFHGRIFYFFSPCFHLLTYAEEKINWSHVAQLGKNTAFIGYVGEDHNGILVRETLSSDGIDLTGLFIDPEGTARSINFVYPDGRRKNFYDGKSHMTLQPDLTLCREILAAAGWPTSHFPTGPAPCCHWPKIWT